MLPGSYVCVCMYLKLFSNPLKSEIRHVDLIHKSILISILLTSTKQCKNWIFLNRTEVCVPRPKLYLDYDKIVCSCPIAFT